MFELFVDFIRVAHILCFAIGIGAAVFMESVVLSRARTYIDIEELALIERGHKLILGAMAGLWITGIMLIAIRTSFNPFAITPKILTKVAVVSALTANAFIIARVVTPMLRKALYGKLADLGWWRLCLIGAAAGLSGAGWLAALTLGAVGVMKTLPGGTLALIYGGMLFGGALLGAALANPIGRREPGAIWADLVAYLRYVIDRVRHAFSPRSEGHSALDMSVEETIYAPQPHGLPVRSHRGF